MGSNKVCMLSATRFYMIVVMIMSAISGASIALGWAVYVVFVDFEPIVGKPYLIAPLAFIISGFYGMFTLIISYIARQTSNIKLTKSALALQVVGFIVTLIALVLGFTMRQALIDSLSESLQLTTPQDELKIWDNIQHVFSCCGANNVTDWCVNQTCNVPHSCCSTGGCDIYTINHDSCLNKLEEYFKFDYYVTLGLLGTKLPIYMIFVFLQLCLPIHTK